MSARTNERVINRLKFLLGYFTQRLLCLVGLFVSLNGSLAKASESIPSGVTNEIVHPEDTYGVLTVESSSVQFYLGSGAGTSSLMGNATLQDSSQMGWSVRTGLLLSEQFSLLGEFKKQSQGLSIPLGGNQIYTGSVNPLEVMELNQNSFGLMGRLFWFARAKRFRPYVGGGFAYRVSNIGYSNAMKVNLPLDSFYQSNYKLKQALGEGSIGLEVALTRWLVLDGSFSIQGVLAYWGEGTGDALVNTHESNKLLAASSLSRTASYSAQIGIGLYF